MIKMSESIANLAEAYAKFQQEVVNPSNTAKNPQFKSNYAPLDEVINTSKPVLAKYGLSVLQSTGSEGEAIKIVSILMHKSGEYIQSDELVLPAYQTKGGGVKEFNAQGAGSAITYGRRYSLSAILGLASEDDDDGNHASGQNNNGYKEASKPSGNGGGLSEAEKEKRKQEALAKAEARKNQSKKENEEELKNELTNEEANEKIAPAQEKAIQNMLNILTRKQGEGFDTDAYVSELLAKYGVSEIKDLTSDNAKAVIAQINKDRAGK
jgi:vacuolar-type H+-ATPase subunit I/STV1